MGKAPRYITPAMGNTLQGWRAIKKQWPDVEPAYRIRAAVIGLVVNILRPFRAFERKQLQKRLDTHQIHESPIFILGHWRSGTTLLHTLLSKDPTLGYLTNVQAMFPHAFITNPVLPWILKNIMPPTRPMDQMKINLFSPQEEELALMNHGVSSLYHMWTFPKHWQAIFEQLVGFRQKADRDRWEQTYLQLLQKISFFQKGRPLVLKNPANTGRIPSLLRLFPKARFIHIYRDPYEVYGSSFKLHTKVLPYFNLQDFSEAQVREQIFVIYEQLMQAYLRDKALIPEDQLMEVDYRELSAQPITELHRIYDYFGLERKSAVTAAAKTYFEATPSPTKQHYQLDETIQARIQKQWSFVPKHWFN